MRGDVYRFATENLIYLGEDDGTMARARLDFISRLQEYAGTLMASELFLTLS